MTVTLTHIQQAAERIKPFAHQTPLLTNESLNQQVGAQVFLKCENLQKVGAFKFRGACNALYSLSDEEAKHGVCTHSSGNHAQALALAARMRGIPAFIVMPNNAPQVKKDAVAGYGGQITFCEPTLEARESTMERIRLDTGATVVHPYNDERVISGQGTATLELLDSIPDLDAIIAPVGGVGCLDGFKSPTFGDLTSAATFCRRFPDLETPRLVRAVIDPPPVTRPTGPRVPRTVVSKLSRYAILHINNENLNDAARHAVKCYLPAIGRPAGRAGGPLPPHGSQLHRGRSFTV